MRLGVVVTEKYTLEAIIMKEELLNPFLLSVTESNTFLSLVGKEIGSPVYYSPQRDKSLRAVVFTLLGSTFNAQVAG